ncbi:HipA family kinase [Ammoniphilus sp. YIM 78166]|uniref:HipA family kinase n=1 Tax=Ammoniphilus sp. YIM 78166 TaxID=1644106 RepID=UPI0010704BC3|nr:HipA family kinase [Ammoniphilus sp. YIM 78166]
MEQKLYPVRFVKSLTGKSRPQLILFSDGFEYVVKFKNNRQGTRVLVNEFVVGHLAQLVDLPIIPFKIAVIPEDFIRENKKLQQRQFEPGHQFASLYLDNCRGLSEEFSPSKSEIANVRQLMNLIAFDHWVSNTDRGKNNILLECFPQSPRQVYIIDHANCFPGGFKWTAETLKGSSKKVLDRFVHQWCFKLMGDPEELFLSIYKILALSDHAISSVINSVPEDWEVSKEEKEGLFFHLIEAKKRLPELMAKYFIKHYMTKHYLIKPIKNSKNRGAKEGI